MEIFHVLNRGVEGRNIFLETGDYVRFVHNLYQFNDTKPADNLHRLVKKKGLRNLSLSMTREREMLVDIHAWVLMKNHYHLLLSERVAGGISRFMKKINIGYANFFNEKYERSGYLFQGRTKKILIKNDAQFNYLPHYVHLNPLDYLPGAKEWRIRAHGKSVRDIPKALAFLRTYRWSSYPDYVGEKNFPSVYTDTLFKDAFGDYEKAVAHYLASDKKEFNAAFTLE